MAPLNFLNPGSRAHPRHCIPTQGLSRLYTDYDADTSVFELLQDIPPEWNVTYAGALV